MSYLPALGGERRESSYLLGDFHPADLCRAGFRNDPQTPSLRTPLPRRHRLPDFHLDFNNPSKRVRESLEFDKQNREIIEMSRIEVTAVGIGDPIIIA